ncbi:alcohol dehydrogenase catalytic domain-containing protein [Nonomuraea ceibae]|uniref:alcohol dehydrogenase catalytic domain-containing protein n=1 Tax=Nonomuraea ceibae TaxID=1935170 RepID=UPI001C5E5245|nr:zinc-binding dehydrogenase [Nonomuraea ceibae]
MRAVVIRAFGGAEVLRIADVPAPVAAEGQVRIRVEAATVNPVDLATRSGALTGAGLLPARDVIGIGWDAAGTVDQIGPGVTGFKPGDRVIGLCDRLDVPLGAQAEHVVLDADAVAAAPAGLSPVEAATLPLNGLTAAQALDGLGLDDGQTLLVTGAAGAVGGFAVQLAVARGLRVVAVAGGAPPPLRGIRVFNHWIRADGAHLSRLAALAEAGALTLRVAGALPLDQVAAAHHRLATTPLRGRLVLTP